jgi:hypothetical protein
MRAPSSPPGAALAASPIAHDVFEASFFRTFAQLEHSVAQMSALHELLWPMLMSKGRATWREKRIGEQLLEIKVTYAKFEEDLTLSESVEVATKAKTLLKQSTKLIEGMNSIRKNMVKDAWPYVPIAARSALKRFFETTPIDPGLHKEFIEQLGQRFIGFFLRLGFLTSSGPCRGTEYKLKADQLAEFEARIVLAKKALVAMQEPPQFLAAFGALALKERGIIDRENELEELKAAHLLRSSTHESTWATEFRLSALGLREFRALALVHH